MFTRVSTRRLSTTASTVAGDALKIKNEHVRKAVLEGEWREGPPSLKTRRARVAYNSPIGLKEVFPLAREVIKKDSRMHYAAAKREAISLADLSDADKKESLRRINHHLVRAELHNPEVVYNHTVNSGVDLSEPIYRYLSERDWKQYEMLVLMQRLETLHVIPDTLPTLEPRAKVDLQFPGPISKNVEPGKLIRNIISSKTPLLEVQEFEKIADDSLYTVLIVDPDTPDLANDSFKTTLHWAVSNIPLSNTQRVVDIAKSDELVAYLPPHPERNSPTHRYCVWVLRQSADPLTVRKIEVDSADVKRQNFDIRAFVSKYELDAVGAHFWRGVYDRSTDAVREKFGLGPGMVYRRTRNTTRREDSRN